MLTINLLGQGEQDRGDGPRFGYIDDSVGTLEG